MSVHPNIRALASASQRPKDLSDGFGGDEVRLQDHDLLRLGSFEGTPIVRVADFLGMAEGRRR
jgi:hypothetical protein